MKLDDQQLGKPARLYQNTKANITALSLAAGDEGCMAYATDTDEIGAFDGAAWDWIVAGVTAFDPDTILTDDDGNILVDDDGNVLIGG